MTNDELANRAWLNIGYAAAWKPDDLDRAELLNLIIILRTALCAAQELETRQRHGLLTAPTPTLNPS